MNNFNDIYETMLSLREEGYRAESVENAFGEDSLSHSLMTTANVVIPTIAKPRGGIFALTNLYAGATIKVHDPPT